mgnify:CR=1 FL=1
MHIMETKVANSSVELLINYGFIHRMKNYSFRKMDQIFKKYTENNVKYFVFHFSITVSTTL